MKFCLTEIKRYLRYKWMNDVIELENLDIIYTNKKPFFSVIQENGFLCIIIFYCTLNVSGFFSVVILTILLLSTGVPVFVMTS